MPPFLTLNIVLCFDPAKNAIQGGAPEGSDTSRSLEIGRGCVGVVYITAWEFEGNIRPTNWGQWEIGEKEGKQYSGRRR